MDQTPQKKIKLKIVKSADEADYVDANPSYVDNVLSADNWKNLVSFKTLNKKETQLNYYKRMNSREEVLEIVGLDSKTFGSRAEQMIKEIFQLGPRTSSQNDGTRLGKKIEIKCARYWAGKDGCLWQHLEPEHDYDIAMFVLLDFYGFKVWCINKELLMGELRDNNIITCQGKQGYWTKKTDIEPYLTEIKTVSDLDMFIQS